MIEGPGLGSAHASPAIVQSFILKLGATGDVVRTTTLLRRLSGKVTWVTERKNSELLRGLKMPVRCLAWEERELGLDRDYDLVVVLEDTEEAVAFANRVQAKRLFGASVEPSGELAYTKDSRPWFDLSLISRFGKEKADQLKLENRRTYQDMIFSGLGLQFEGEPYVLPASVDTELRGDIALSPQAGPVWPMKNWAYYDELQQLLEKEGLKVNRLPVRRSLLEHMGDVANHKCLVSGDSLPMHFALGLGVRCVTLFTCTSPWEIYDYGVQTKIVSPLLKEFFFKRGFDPRAVTAISVEEVFEAVMKQLRSVRR